MVKLLLLLLLLLLHTCNTYCIYSIAKETLHTALTHHLGTVGWITHASIHRMPSYTVAEAIKGSFKTAAPQRGKQTRGNTRANEGTGFVDIHKHSCHCRSLHRSNYVERVKALTATESHGRAAGPGGMLRNVTVSVNQADTKVCKTLKCTNMVASDKKNMKWDPLKHVWCDYLVNSWREFLKSFYLQVMLQ